MTTMTRLIDLRTARVTVANHIEAVVGATEKSTEELCERIIRKRPEIRISVPLTPSEWHLIRRALGE